ncbi:MAG: hypothetical protein ACK5N8_09125 [Alphaproteobacteria bacterium]
MRFILVLFLILMPYNVYAQITDVQNDMEEEVPEGYIEEVGDEGEDSEEEVSEETDRYVSVAVELNRELSQATYQMGDDLLLSIDDKYAANGGATLDDFTNELVVEGFYDENGTTLRYEFKRSFLDVIKISDYFKGDYSQTKSKKISTLDGENEIDLRKFAVRRINGRPYLSYYNRRENELYLMAAINPYLSLKIQAKGPKYFTVTKQFLNSFGNFKYQKEIVGGDKKVDFNKIREKVKKGDKIKELMGKIK